MAASHDLAGGLKGAGKGAKGCHWWVWIYIALSFALITIGAFTAGASYWNHTLGHTLYAPCQPDLTAKGVVFGSSPGKLPIMNFVVTNQYGPVPENQTSNVSYGYVPVWNVTLGTGPNQCNIDYKDLAITGVMIPVAVAVAGFWGLAWTAGKKYQNITHPIEHGIVGGEKQKGLGTV